MIQENIYPYKSNEKNIKQDISDDKRIKLNYLINSPKVNDASNENTDNQTLGGLLSDTNLVTSSLANGLQFTSIANSINDPDVIDMECINSNIEYHNHNHKNVNGIDNN